VGVISQFGLFTPESGVRLHLKLNTFPSTYALETFGSLFRTLGPRLLEARYRLRAYGCERSVHPNGIMFLEMDF
jgi:hypothetical protein